MATPLKGTINVALIGGGFIGQVHSKMLRLIADRTAGSVRVGCVYDRTREAAEKLASCAAIRLTNRPYSPIEFVNFSSKGSPL